MARPFSRERWRCTELEVKEILKPGKDYDLINNPSLKPFVHASWSIVNDIIHYELGLDSIRINTGYTGSSQDPFRDDHRDRDDNHCHRRGTENRDINDWDAERREWGEHGEGWHRRREEVSWDSPHNLEFIRGTERHSLIETWLAAHFYKLSDRGLQNENINGASGSFMGNSSTGFEATQYGQNAKRLDKSGYLVILDERRIVSGGLTAPGAKAGGFWLGTKTCRRTNY